MPELPEVETLKRELAVIIGKQFATASQFATQLRNQTITAVDRRAKILIISLSGGDKLLVHLKMTGQLIFVPATGEMVVGGHPQTDPFRYTRATFHFSDQSKLYFNDLRKFGWLKLLDEMEAKKILDKHGVEPLTKAFTLAKFTSILARYPKRKIKQLLLDQTLIAGLGNIYVDEACFLAKVLPTRVAYTLTKSEIKNLHAGIISVLKLSISKKGTSARNYVRSDGTRGGFVPYLNVYGRKGETCKRPPERAGSVRAGCKGVITKIKLNGRGTHYCERCQK